MTAAAVAVLRVLLLLCFCTVFTSSFFFPQSHKAGEDEEAGSTSRGFRKHGPRVKLHKLKSKDSHVHAAFDPVVMEREQRQEDYLWEKEKEEQGHRLKKAHEQNGDEEEELFEGVHEEEEEEHELLMGDADYSKVPDEDYMEDDFNMTARLVTLFPLIDINPPDGLMSKDELLSWHLRQGHAVMLRRSSRELSLYDSNKDGHVSGDEYWHRDFHGFTQKGEVEQGEPPEKFTLADADGDQLLNVEEFNDFLHPEDSHNPALLAWVRRREIRARDVDNDGKLGWQEFYDTVYPAVEADMYEEHGLTYEMALGAFQGRLHSAKETFAKNDINNDKFIDEAEIGPLMTHLVNTEVNYAQSVARRIMTQVDDDRDGLLSLSEVLAHPNSFYETVDVDDSEEYAHDELR